MSEIITSASLSITSNCRADIPAAQLDIIADFVGEAFWSGERYIACNITSALSAAPVVMRGASAALHCSAQAVASAIGRTSYPHLLPPNATKLEQSYAGATGRLTNVPLPIEDVWRWQTCPEPLLPWLAWALSVDLWNPKWSTETKRSIIRDSLLLHFKKGTLYAQRRYLSYAGSPLRHAITPPDTAFAGATMTEDERQRWLARFPQVRIFRFLSRGQATYGAFTKGSYKLAKTFLGDSNFRSVVFPYQTDAWERWGLRAFYWDQGPHPLATGANIKMRWIERERQVVRGVMHEFERGYIPGSKVQALFIDTVGNVDGRMFPTESYARARTISIERLSEYGTEADHLIKVWAVNPDMRPIQIVPEKVAELGQMQRGINVFMGMPGRWLNVKTKTRHRIKGFLLGYLPETTSPLRLYDRVHLHDQNRLPDRRPQSTYLNHTRLGLPAFHAILMPDIKGRRTLWQAGRFIFGALWASDMEPLTMTRDAVKRAMSKRDKILLKTALNKTITTKLGIRTTDGYRSGQTALTI